MNLWGFWPTSVFILCSHALSQPLNIMIAKDTTQGNHSFCLKHHCLRPLRRSWGSQRVLSANGCSNLSVICRPSEWQCGSVQWFVPQGWSSLRYCCRQQLCYNSAWMQDTGICWIQGGVFSIREWNTFSASRVAWRTTAKGPWQHNDAWHNSTTVS